MTESEEPLVAVQTKPAENRQRKSRKRASLSKRVRFEVFKRDKFACQYCGRRPPDIVLQIEHIEAVARGGTNDIINLLTSCEECNAGKSDIPLSDDTAIAKQHAQLANLQERREQQQMMIKWRKELLKIGEETTESLAEHWSTVAPGCSLTPAGERSLAKWLKKHGIDYLLRAMEVAADKHLVFKEGQPTQDSVNAAWVAIEGTAKMLRLQDEDPAAAKIRYIRGIMRNRFSYCPDPGAIELIENAHGSGLSLIKLEQFAKRARNWSDFNRMIDDFFQDDPPPVQPKPVEPPGVGPRAALQGETSQWSEELLWYLVGAAKGLNLRLAADVLKAAETQEEREERFRSADVTTLPEAVGLADALQLMVSNRRAQYILELGGLDTDIVEDIRASTNPHLQQSPVVIFDDDWRVTQVRNPPPRVGSGPPEAFPGDEEFHEQLQCNHAHQALMEEVPYLGVQSLWELVGYAKGTRLRRAAEPTDEEPSPSQIESDEKLNVNITEPGEAYGFGSALSLLESTQRAERLLAIGEFGTAFVWEVTFNYSDHLPRAPFLFYTDGVPEKVKYPCPSLPRIPRAEEETEPKAPDETSSH